MSTKQEVLAEVSKKFEEGEVFLIGIGEALQFPVESLLATTDLYKEKKDVIEQLSEEERKWIARAVYARALEHGNPVLQQWIDLYNLIFEKIRTRAYYVVNLCTDGLIEKSNFPKEKYVNPCGSILKGQCIENCEDEITDLRPVYESILDAVKKETDASELSMKLVDLIPRCEKCGKDVIVNTAVGNKAYCEKGYLDSWAKYTKWLQCTLNRKIVLVELGVGFDTPTVVRWPFEKITFFNQKAYLIRVHERLFQLTDELQGRAAGIGMKPARFIKDFFAPKENDQQDKVEEQDK